ncbi:hypothetical protein ERJ75_000675100 [Trypanosoma vivax]|nr:hypothetical protein ERJ75_000675100 [Trypanosoma vivax]
MTYTHHALEASLKSLLQLVDRSDHRIGVFAPRDESLMQYGIRLHSSPLDTEGLTSVLKDFMSIVKATRINPDLEKQILAVMQKHGPHMRCTAYTRTRHNEMVSVLGKPTQDYGVLPRRFVTELLRRRDGGLHGPCMTLKRLQQHCGETSGLMWWISFPI